MRNPVPKALKFNTADENLIRRIMRKFQRWWIPQSMHGGAFYGCSENWGAKAAYIEGYKAGMAEKADTPEEEEHGGDERKTA